MNSDLARENIENLKENVDYTFSKSHFGKIILEHYTFLKQPACIYDEILIEKEHEEDFKKAFQFVLKPYLNYQRILIVGLGNRHFNADALGPFVVEQIKWVDQVYLFIPRVSGQSGMDSGEQVKLLVDHYSIDLVIVIDSLAALHSNALYSMVQINDYGLAPGSGVGGVHKALTQETLNAKVIAIGVPCVIKTSHLINEFYRYCESYFYESLYVKDTLLKVGPRKLYQGELPLEKKRFLLGQIGLLNNKERLACIEEIMEPIAKNYVVTSKVIDEEVIFLAKCISSSLNDCLKNRF